MFKRIVLLNTVLALCVALVLAMAGVALASYNYASHSSDHSMVAGSAHDVTRTVAGANPCDNCHIPHSAKGTFLFARSQSGVGGFDSPANDPGVSSSIEPICYSCHDGTGVNNGTGLATVFSPQHTNHPTHSASSKDPSGTAYGAGRDCDLCHDPHDDGNTSFLRYEQVVEGKWMPVSVGGTFCASCHSEEAEMPRNHAVGVPPGRDGTVSHLPVDSVWSPAANDYSGARLYDPGSHLVSIATNAVVECGSCHTPHGAEPSATIGNTPYHSLNTMRSGPDPADPAAAFLCLNCH